MAATNNWPLDPMWIEIIQAGVQILLAVSAMWQFCCILQAKEGFMLLCGLCEFDPQPHPLSPPLSFFSGPIVHPNSLLALCWLA